MVETLKKSKALYGLLLYSVSLVFAARGECLGELPTDRPLVIAHRGSSGELPEHTVEAYQRAVDQGADVIECDLVVTKDLQLVCNHEPWLSLTTDVAKKFPERIRTVVSKEYNVTITDYFTIDFTLEELKTLRKIQPRKYRDQSYNGLYTIASFEESIAVAKSSDRTVGIYPETKFPPFFNQYLAYFNTTMEDLLITVLEKHGYNSAKPPCFVQSFDPRSIKHMAKRTKCGIVFLTATDVTDELLSSMLSYVTVIGPEKNVIIEVDDETNRIVKTTNFMERVKMHGYKVHPYTLRNEDRHLAYDYSADPYNEYEIFVNLGVDGIFTDYPATMVKYLATKECQEREKKTNTVRLMSFVADVFTRLRNRVYG